MEAASSIVRFLGFFATESSLIEISSANVPIRSLTDYVRSTVDLLTKLVPGKFKAARRQKAISTYATLVGAMVLARAVDDRALSQEILDAGRASVKT
jgi:TetR/AcrR family transcriptional repressor of nem operon